MAAHFITVKQPGRTNGHGCTFHCCKAAGAGLRSWLHNSLL